MRVRFFVPFLAALALLFASLACIAPGFEQYPPPLDTPTPAPTEAPIEAGNKT